MFKLRRAVPEDIEAVREIYASAAGREAVFDEDYLNRLISAGGLLVAEETAGVVGFGSIEVDAAEHVRWLYVLPGRQRGGIGSALLVQLERVGWAAGLRSIRLHAAPGAAGFYRRNGYREATPDEEVGHDHEGVEMLKIPRMETANANVSVRFAAPADLEFVRQDGHLPAEVVRRKIEWQEVIVAELGGDPVGYVRLEYLWSKLPYIALIHVLPACRRRGVGRALLCFTEGFLREGGHTALYSSSQADEPEPQAWHRRVGFRECGVIAGVNEGGVGELFFRKEI